MKIGAVVVLFHPDQLCLDRILTWSQHCDQLLLVDNSPTIWNALQDLLSLKSNTIYLHDGVNHGIANALNKALNHFAHHGFDWVLTMDQDSTPPADIIPRLLHSAQSSSEWDRFALISPKHLIGAQSKQSGQRVEPQLTLMTSGNLLRIKAWQDIGAFDETLFIDGVDDDFCLRARLKNWLTVQANDVIMPHSLGQLERRTIASRNYFPSNHSPLRRYYITRNRLILLLKYRTEFPEFSKNHLINILRESMLIVLFEKQKISKLAMSILGVFHALMGRRGKL